MNVYLKGEASDKSFKTQSNKYVSCTTFARPWTIVLPEYIFSEFM